MWSDPTAQSGQRRWNTSNTASVRGESTSGPATSTASTSTPLAGIAVTKDVDKTSAKIGATLTYTITVTNNGAVAYTPVLTDTECVGLSPAPSLLSPGGSATFTCTHVLVATDPDPYVNTVYVTGNDGNPATTDPSANDAASTAILAPAITVSKSVDKLSAQVGETLTYTITVVNTGEVPYTPVITDAQCGAVSPTPVLLAVDTTATFTCTHTLVAADPKPYVNTVSVTGDDGDPATTDVTGSSEASTTVLTPAIEVSKSVDKPLAQVGQTLTYTITVTNTGGVPYTPVITDTLCAGMTPTPGVLDVGATATFTCSHVLVAADPNPYVNTVSVTGDDGIAVTTDATGAAAASTDRLTSSITVSKSADKASAQPGESITWTVMVENTGDVALTPTITDLECTLGAVSGDGGVVSVLDAGETWTVTCSTTMPATGDASNTVSVTTTDGIAGTTDPTGTATDTVTPLTSSITVSKSADKASAQPGESITWTATVKNTGQVALTVNPPTDTVCPGITRVNSDANGLLDPGETWTYRCTTTMGGSTVTNTFSVTTTDGITGTTDPTGSDAATVTPLTSSIAVTKVADRSTAQPGETITWTVTVQNTGAVPLTATMDDSICSLAKTGGDAVNVGVLDPAETWTYRCTTIMGAASVTNTVTVTTDDGISGTTDPQRSEQATVNVRNSTILVKKTADKTVAQLGETVTWTVTVENTGQVGLTPTASDPMCTLTKTGGDTANVGVLDPGEKWTYQCTTTMGDASVTNTATVTTSDGIAATTDPQGEDSATVNSVDSGIAVEKVADKSAAQPGETITWTVTVENTALVPLTPTVDDPGCTLTKTGGDPTNVGVLDPGEKWTYQCTTTMGTSAVTNIVTVTTDDGVPGTTDPQGTESATVNPLTSSILVKKSADKVSAQQGDTVTWTVTVENTGQVNLTPTVSDPMCTLTKTGGDTVNVGVLDPGEIWSYRCTTTMGGAPVTNTATVTTSDGITGTTDPGGADSATVNLLVSSVLVEKTADRVAAKPGQVITWTVKVTNNGQVPLTPTALDPQCTLGAPTGDNGNEVLDVQEVWTYLCTTTMGTADATNTVTVSTSDGNSATTDPTGSATDTVTYTPLVPAIDVTKVADKEIAQPGEPIVWAITVTNTGETPLTPTLQDPQGTPTYVSGDTNGDKVLDIGETWVYSLTTTMGDATVSGPVTVLGDDGNPLTTNPQASAVDTVTLVSQHMTVHKTSDKQVYVVGDTVTWTVTLTNDGEVAITPSLSDPMGTPTYRSGDTNGNEVLDVGETWVYTYTSVVSSTGDIANTVAVATTDGNTYTTDVSGQGTRTITVVPEPSSSISVDKSADRSAARAGERITWTIAVTNTGQTVLTPAVSDALCTDLRLASGDADANGRLDPGERFVYLCTSTIGGAAVTNTAQVTTTLDDGRPGPNASSSATVPRSSTAESRHAST